MDDSNLPSNKLADDIIWGGEAIADEIGKDKKSTLYHLARGHIEAAFKVGNLWGATRSGLRRQFRVGVPCRKMNG